MDNASKALIMAGAILIAVAIVGIGIYIFSSSNALTNDAVNRIDTVAVQMFNNTFTQYAVGVGADPTEKINGTRAKQLYDVAKATKGISLDGSLTSFNARTGYKVTYGYDTTTQYINSVKIEEAGAQTPTTK